MGVPRTVEWHGRQVRSAIWKSAVEGRVPVRGVNLEGDDQADRRVHGGDGKAVYAYSVEDYAWWSETTVGRGWSPDIGPLAAGTFGENLTTSGLSLNDCRVGDAWRIGDLTLEVVQPRFPCFKLGMRMGDAGFVDRFKEACRPRGVPPDRHGRHGGRRRPHHRRADAVPGRAHYRRALRRLSGLERTHP